MSEEGRLLTFGQRTGMEPIPEQLKHGEIGRELRSLVWAGLYGPLRESRYAGNRFFMIGQPWHGILSMASVILDKAAIDEFPSIFDHAVKWAKEKVFSKNFLETMNFLDFVVADPNCPAQVVESISEAFKLSSSAYRIIARQIIPITSEENAAAVERGMVVAATHTARGPSTHLRAAAIALTGRNWSDAIRESIHAVEGAGKVVEPDADTLGPALAKLERRGLINGAQKKAFAALYGFTSDNNGVRHALAYEEEAKVTEQDALFMFGACAAFVGYLLSAAE